MATIRSLLRIRFWTAAAPLLALTLAIRTRSGSRARILCRHRFCRADRDLAAISEPHEAGGDDALVRVEPALDHRLAFILFLHDDWTYGHRVVVLDHVDEGAVWAPLNGTGGNDHHLLERIDQQTNIDELPGPELQVRVWKFGLEFHRTGRLVHLVVDHLERSAIENGVIVRTQGIDRKRALGESSIHLGQILLRQVERHRDRLKLGDHNDRGRTCRADDVALVDLAYAGAAVDRRDDGGVAELCPRVFDRRLVGLHNRGVLRHQSALGIGLLLADCVGRSEPFIALKVELRVGKLSFVLRLLGNRLVELRLVGDGIDTREDITLFDVLTLRVIDAQKLAIDLGRDSHGVECLDGSDGIEIDGYIGARDGGDEHGDRPFGGKAAAAALLCGWAAEHVI